MKNTFKNLFMFAILTALFLGAVLGSTIYLSNYNVDLTKGKIYSLSISSQQIASSVKDPITLTLFFSENTSNGMTVVRDYKARVESLLEEYQRLSKGKITLEVIDPEPFSEAEDKAASFGLTAAATGIGQNTIYFGLAGTNKVDDALVISFFDPQNEASLEYDISSLIYQLKDPKPLNLTIVTDLQIAGGQNPLNGQTTPAYALYQQLTDIFEVSLIGGTEEAIPDNTQVLLLWHPQNLNESLLRSIDQFLMSSGKALALVDAHYESDPLFTSTATGVNSSSLELLSSYGISFDNTQIVLDALTGLEVRNSQGGSTRHLGFLGLGKAQINGNDITTGELDSINGASFGTIGLSSKGLLTQTTLLTTSQNSALISASSYSEVQDPAQFTREFTSGNKVLTLAARFSGAATSYFADNIDNDPTLFVRQTDNLHLVVVADADIAADRFWVQQSNFFGQTVLSPFADNGDFLINTLENLSGSEKLIGIRSRGTFTRPFTKVQEIQVVAEEKFREQERRLQAQLEQTEDELMQLQTQDENLVLTAEQKSAIDAFSKQRYTIRKSLRDVQFQLQKDIDELGNVIKLINIVATPLMLVTLLFLLSKLFRKRAPKQLASYARQPNELAPNTRLNKNSKVRKEKLEPVIYLDDASGTSAGNDKND